MLIVGVVYGVDALISVMALPFGSEWVYIEGNTVFLFYLRFAKLSVFVYFLGEALLVLVVLLWSVVCVTCLNS